MTEYVSCSLIHSLFFCQFLGDIGQPLHVEALEEGGNLIPTICDGKDTNLHATWDTGMIVKMVGSTFNGDTQSWASALAQEIKTGSYKSLAPGWISCSSTTKPFSPDWTIEEDVQQVLGKYQSAEKAMFLACPLVWAKEANRYDCVCLRLFWEGILHSRLFFSSRTCSIMLMAQTFAKALTSKQTSQS